MPSHHDLSEVLENISQNGRPPTLQEILDQLHDLKAKRVGPGYDQALAREMDQRGSIDQMIAVIHEHAERERFLDHLIETIELALILRAR